MKQTLELVQFAPLEEIEPVNGHWIEEAIIECAGAIIDGLIEKDSGLTSKKENIRNCP